MTYCYTTDDQDLIDVIEGAKKPKGILAGIRFIKDGLGNMVIMEKVVNHPDNAHLKDYFDLLTKIIYVPKTES